MEPAKKVFDIVKQQRNTNVDAKGTIEETLKKGINFKELKTLQKKLTKIY